MAEQSDQVHPLAAHGTPRSDAEAGDNLQSKELRHKKRMKCYISMAIFAVIQVTFMLVFSLIILPVDTPKLRLSAVTVNNLSTSTQAASPSFNMSIMAHVRVKNTNFGTYKYEPSTISFMYGDTILEEENIPKASAKARSTKKVDLSVNLDSKIILNDSKLGSDVKSGLVQIASISRVFGEVKMFLVVKKKREAVMNCTMIVNLTTKAVQNLECK